MSKTAFEQPVQEQEKSADIWEKIDKELPATLEGTSFKIPYEQIPVRQLITRAEFAREVGQETTAQSHIGRKVSRKSFRHPLSQEDYVVIKSNRGNSPQLVFSFNNPKESEFDINSLPSPKDVAVFQKSKYGELMDDKRSVKLSRILKGTNVKGKEDQTFYYLDVLEKEPTTKYIFKERAWESPKPFDYVSSGLLAERDGEQSRTVLFCKAQSSRLNNDTLFFIVEYINGKPVSITTKKISLTELPIFEEVLRENPDILFKTSNTADKISDFSGEVSIEDVTMNFPMSIEPENINSMQFEFKFNKAELPERVGEGANLEVHVDPEVDSDLDETLKKLKKNLGSKLLEVYFYGSIPRGYKRLQSDIDLIAVISDKESVATDLGGFESEPFLIHDALGTHTAMSSTYPYRNIEVHTIKESKFKKPDNLRLSEFLRNALDGAVKIYWK